MDGVFGNIKIISGTSNPALAESIAKHLGLPLCDAEVTKFSDGEIALNINESVRGADVYIIQSTGAPSNDNLMELLIMCDAMRRASAGRINAVIPYYGYARQDRKAKSHDPISAKLVANLITKAGADRVITMDLHSSQIQGFFDIPLDHLVGVNLIADYFRSLNLDNSVIVAPDAGSVKRTRHLAKIFNLPFALIDKERPRPNETAVMNVIGEIKGKNCFMLDDMIDTAGTICTGADALMQLGAKSVHAGCTHGVFSGPARERIAKSGITELISLDTLAIPDEATFPKLKVLHTGEIFANCIKRIHFGQSLSDLFEVPRYS